VVVCAHGYSGNAHDFDPLAGELAQAARVICPDVAGRGQSDWLAAPFGYNFTQFLADFRSLLAHIGVDAVDWIGTSMGGLLGLMLAAQARSPIRSLVMNDVGAFVPLEALRRIAGNLHAPERFASLAEVEAHLRRTHADWGEITDAQWASLVRHGARKVEGGYRLHYDPRIAQVVQPPPFAPGLYFWSEWYRVRCPVLLVRGEHSEVFPPSVAAAMVAAKPGTERVEVAGAGHAPALMSAAEIATVREFVESAGEARALAREKPVRPVLHAFHGRG
jgi:pimeloyl-ACP methyl ester carboxylesterase